MLKLVTSNLNKLKEFQRMSTTEFSIEKGLDLREVDADERTVAIYKAIEAGDGTVVEDTVLIVEGVPVVDIRYRLAMLNDLEDIVPAIWRTTLAVNQHGKVTIYEGQVVGELVPGAVPEDAFGFDANFVPAGLKQSLYDLEKAGEKDLFSARFLALKKIELGEPAFEIEIDKVKPWTGAYQS